MRASALGIMLAACPLATANTGSVPGFAVWLPSTAATGASKHVSCTHVVTHVGDRGWLRRRHPWRAAATPSLGAAGGTQATSSPLSMIAGGVLVDSAGVGAVPAGDGGEELGDGDSRPKK